MALIPDEAVDRMYTELTSGARDLYIYLARCRNQKTGKCCPSVQTIMSSINLSRPRIYALRSELEAKKWAKFQANNAELLVGFKNAESLENETISDVSKEFNLASGESLENKTPSLENKTNSLENKTKLSCFQDSHIRKNQQREPAKEQETAPFQNPGIGDALEDTFPGHASNFRTMAELHQLCERVQATAEDVRRFPDWLKTTYPMKSISPFAFKDLLAESLKSRPVVKVPDPNLCPTCRGKKVVLKNGMDKFRGGTPTMPCPDCSNVATNSSTENSNVISSNRFAIA